MDAGVSHSLVLSPTGCVFTFGHRPQMSDPIDGGKNPKPKIVKNLPPIASVAAGNHYSLFVDFDANVWILGSFAATVLNFFTAEPVKIELGNVKIKIAEASRNFYYVLLDTEGDVWGCGYNGYGQLGFGNFDDVAVPTKIEDLPKISNVSAGFYHLVLLDENGDVWTCGYNSYGQLGRPTDENKSPFFEKLDLPVKFTAVEAGDFHTILLDVNGTVWRSESPTQGQIFQPCTIDVRIQFITAGSERSLLIDEEGGLWCAEAEGTINLTRLIEAETACAVAASCGKHHIMLDSAGKVWVWGSNESGQLGLGTFDKVKRPVVNTLLPSLLRYSKAKSARN